MSFTNDDMYKKVVPEEIMSKPPSTDDNSSDLIVLPKSEQVIETLVVEETTVDNENLHMHINKDGETIFEDTETSESFNKEMNENIKLDTESAEYSLSLSSDCEEKQGWSSNDTNEEASILKQGESPVKAEMTEITNDDQGGDEETIATFVTAAGQQLALYAVEDSEEIFAVAVYDESGEPPTNFQFLMKSDVERLIGEGAVRTVKKPSQIKKQLLAAQPSIFFSKAEQIHQVLGHEERISINHQRVAHNIRNRNSSLFQESSTNINTKDVPNIVYTNTSKNSTNFAFVAVDDIPANDQSEGPEREHDEEVEFMEQSTVQYILFETDEPEAELTFDEVEATLQHMKSYERAIKKPDVKKISRNQSHQDNEKRIQNDYPRNNCRILNHKIDTTAEQKFMADRQELLDTLGDSPPNSIANDTNQSLLNGSLELTLPETAQVQLRTKRSRKQQLVSVNREDSEIIIQPAVLMDEEDNNVKKPTKRRRKIVPHSEYHRNSEKKRIKRVKRKEVEVIEIDIDEDEHASESRKDVEEITLDDNKDKYSSDKENEIIMVGDSDDESQQADVRTTVRQCQYCSRTFRQQRALETHLRVCSKSPTNSKKLNEQKAKNVSQTSNEAKKQYPCKICQEKFDVVVALARHVRSQHSQRKKRRFSKSPVESATDIEPEPEVEPEQANDNEKEKEKETENGIENAETESKKNKASMETKVSKMKLINRVKSKRSQRSSRSWESKKLSCSDCGRWFPSTALLNAHYLQHKTKKTEQRVRRCQICKKLIKSRLLYIRHLRMHNSTEPKSISSIQKKLHTTRPVTRKITALRKRGRGRKL